MQRSNERDGHKQMSSIPQQVGQNVSIQPFANQMNFGQLVGRCNGWNPSVSPSVVQNVCNDIVRRVYDRRSGRWYGLMVKGNIITPGYYSVGTVNLTFGSNIVVGNGTSFTPSLVNQQLRVGFTSPIYTITAFIDATHLQLELPWGMPTQLSTSYFVTQFYYQFNNLRGFYSVKNIQLMFRMALVTQSLLENWDPSRLQMLFPYCVASMPPSANSEFQVELWPVPNTQQAYPYLGWTIPANMVNDLDNMPAFIRPDIIELGVIAELLLYKPKGNPNYSENLALEMSKRFTGMFESELQHAMEIDEGMFRQDVLNFAETFPSVNIDPGSGAYLGPGGGGFLAAMSPVSSYGWDY